jgi:hypothetical protein
VAVVVVFDVVMVLEVVAGVVCAVEQPATTSAPMAISPSHDARLVATKRRYTSTTTTFQEADLDGAVSVPLGTSR